jgi:hypothetical protein
VFAAAIAELMLTRMSTISPIAANLKYTHPTPAYFAIPVPD